MLLNKSTFSVNHSSVNLYNIDRFIIFGEQKLRLKLDSTLHVRMGPGT